MKKILLAIVLAALSCAMFAAVSGYTFTPSVGTYAEITGGTLLGSATSDDQRFVDPAVPLGGTTTTGVGFPIGFNFIYDGVIYDRFAINNNGWISLGQSALTPSVNISTSSSYTPLGSTTVIAPPQLVARIAGLGKDLQAQTGAELRIETIGAPGSYECVVQWKNYKKYGSSGTGDSYNFQIRLQEAGNKVVLMYGTMTNNANATTIQVGLRGAPDNVASNYKTLMTDAVTPSWNPPLVGAAVTSSLALSSTVYPLSGTTYEFQAPTVGVLSVSPNPVAFGNSYVGLTKTLTVTLSNSGAADFTLNSVTLDVYTYFNMGTLPALPEVLSPGETYVFDVTYTPTDPNPHAAIITINDDRSTTPINVTGTGVPLLVGEICEYPYLATLPLVNYLGTTAGYANDYIYQMYTGVISSGYVLGKDWVTKFTIPSIGLLDVSLLNQAGYSGQYMGMFLVNTIPSIAAPAAILAQAYGSNAPQNIVGYNITPGDYYLIIDNWPSPADIYFDLSITFTPASAPPNPALLVSPTPDGTLNVAPTATLNWATGGGTVEKYYLYFGMDGGGVTPPTGIENGLDLNLLTTYNPTPDLQYGMTYYWQIVPWNSIGGFAVNCPIWSFTVMPDPTITTFPYMEGFEGGVIPNGWSLTAGAGATRNWEVVTTDASHGAAAPYEGDYFARLYVYLASTTYNPYSLVTPPLDLSGGAKKLGYWAWIGADGAAAPLDVEISTDGMATWNLLYSFDLTETNAWIYREHSLAAYAGGTAHIRFKATSNYGYNFCDLGLDYITIQDESQVPVELSSFTATLTAQNFVQLTWVSQSESQMVGYLVYRSASDAANTAVQIDSPLIQATNTSTTQSYSVTDKDVEIGTTYYYWLEAIDYTSSAYHGPVSVIVEGNVPPVLPEITTMKNAYPNPFKASGSTNIEVALKAGETGTVSIYNISGQLVRSFSVSEGVHTINWNGRDNRGNNCGSGVYFYKLTTPSLNQTRKLVIVK